VIYISSYLVLAGVGYLAPSNWRDYRPLRDDVRRESFDVVAEIFQYLAVASHTVLWIWAVNRVIHTDMEKTPLYTRGPYIFSYGLTLVALGFLFFWISFAILIPFTTVIYTSSTLASGKEPGVEM
jgi:hypothetical protein